MGRIVRGQRWGRRGRSRRRWRVALVAVFLLALALAPWWLSAVLRARSSNPVRRGQRLAGEMSCFSCHRGAVNREAGNLGSARGTIPLLGDGTLRLYAADSREVREWIASGYPRSLRDDRVEWERYRTQLVHMPAFEDRLDPEQIDDLVAFVLAIDAYQVPQTPLVARGQDLVQRHCLSCHGPGGAGGRPNPGSLSGYVPALWGPDFDDLVRDREELVEWVTLGASSRVAGWPLVSWFWRRQLIRMPAFGERLTEEEIEAVVAYLGWLGQTSGGAEPAP